MENSKLKIQNSKMQCKIFYYSFIILIFALFILNYNCYAQSVTSTELINQAKAYDGKEVVYVGEVIGDIMIRGDHAWLNINDGKNAIGIWAGKDLIKDIVYTGSYKFQGDVLEVGGIFHRACLEHGGDLDIHAAILSKMVSGKRVCEVLNWQKRKSAVLLLGALFIVWILALLKHR